MQNMPRIQFHKSGFNKHYLTLTASQKQFADLVLNWLKDLRNLLVIISGGPGTGKSYAVKNTLDFLNTVQLKMAPKAKNACSLGGRTIHSALNLAWTDDSPLKQIESLVEHVEEETLYLAQSQVIQKAFQCPISPTIIIIDEIATVNAWLVYWMIDYFMTRTPYPLLFVVMGDSYQLNPVKCKYNIFSLTCLEKLCEVRRLHFTEGKRFTPEYEGIIRRLKEFINEENEMGLFEFLNEKYPIVEAISRKMILEVDRILCYRTRIADYYNKIYVDHKMAGEPMQLNLSPDRHLEDTNYFNVKPNCLVRVTRNGYSNVCNGTELLFKAYNETRDEICCIDAHSQNEVWVRRCSKWSFPIELAFAGTIHKFQGETLNETQILIHFGGSRDLRVIYTALSRVRSMSQILAVCL